MEKTFEIFYGLLFTVSWVLEEPLQIIQKDTVMAKTADTKKDAKKKPAKTAKEKKLAKQEKKKRNS